MSLRGNALAARPSRQAAVPLRGRLIRTQYGHCDYETARFLAEEGAITELVETEDGWVLDEDGVALGLNVDAGRSAGSGETPADSRERGREAQARSSRRPSTS